MFKDDRRVSQRRSHQLVINCTLTELSFQITKGGKPDELEILQATT